MWHYGYTAPNPVPTPSPAYFKILIENACQKPIEVAIYYEGLDGQWTTRGWYEISAGTQAPLVDTKQAKYYTYARTKDQMINWKGNDTFQKVTGEKKYGFALKQIPLSSYGTWKETFNCPEAGSTGAEEASKADTLFASGDYIAAAKKGHAEALQRTLDSLFFRAYSLRLADPQKALEIYNEAQQANPDLSLRSLEEDGVKTMKMCVEPQGFDAEHFIRQYDIEDEGENNAIYQIWELAEEASRGMRFGNPDPELVLNLICRGGCVPAELELAVKDVYANWRNGVVKEFKICHYALSGAGQTYCSMRKNEVEEEARELELQDLLGKLGSDAVPLLKNAYESAVKFIDEKAGIEEGPGGTGAAAQVLDSEIRQKKEYLKFIEDIQAGFLPNPQFSLAKDDKELNALYKKVLEAAAKKQLFMQSYLQVKPDDLRAVQRLWISYRDASIALFAHICPKVDRDIWKRWLTEQRVKNFRELLEDSEK
jgi:hypothetical protein